MIERILVEGMSDDEHATVWRLLEKLEQTRERNLTRSSYYDGKRFASRVSPILPPQYHRLGLVLGWSAKAVDALARRCHVDEMVWPGGDLGSLGIDEFAEANRLRAELHAARTKAMIHGVSFLVNTVGAEGEPRSLLHMKDALNATGTWNVRTRQLDDFLSVLGRDGSKITEFALYLDGLTISARSDNGRWSVTDRQEHAYGVPAEAVIFKPQGRDFGYSRITRPIMGLQDAAVRGLARMEGHMDVYSYPELWMLGATQAIFKDEAGNQLPNWKVMMGRIKGIPDDDSQDTPRADVKQFSASSPEPHLAQINALAKMFAREADLPDTAVAITDVANPTSAESYDSSQYELIAAAEEATGDMTIPFARAVRRGLQILNGLDGQPVEWASIRPKWRDPRFSSRASMADAGAKIAGAVPGMAETSVGLELMGLTADQIERFQSERRRANGGALLAGLRGAAGTEPLASGVGG